MAMSARGTDCPPCAGKEKTMYVALLPYKEKQPHQYCVGLECYRKQWKQVYPEEKCPV